MTTPKTVRARPPEITEERWKRMTTWQRRKFAVLYMIDAVECSAYDQSLRERTGVSLLREAFGIARQEGAVTDDGV